VVTAKVVTAKVVTAKVVTRITKDRYINYRRAGLIARSATEENCQLQGQLF